MNNYRDLERLMIGNARIGANTYIEGILKDRLIQAKKDRSNDPDWQDKSKNRARIRLLTGSRIRSIIWFLWHVHTFKISGKKLEKLADSYDFPYLTAKAVYPWFIQLHLQALISQTFDVDSDSSLEQERRILVLLSDIGLLDKKIQKNGKKNNILLKPNNILKHIGDEYLDILGSQIDNLDEGDVA